MITDARQELADALTGRGYSVYDHVTENPIPPAIVLVPGEPYLEPVTIGSNRYLMTFEVTLMVAYIDNQAALINLEKLMESFLDALPEVGVVYGAFSRPGRVTVGPSEALATKITLQITTTRE